MSGDEWRNREQGNAFFIVMLGIVLFAALMMTFSRGARQGGENITEKQAQLAATDIISYAQKVERAVGYIQSKRTSENDISFNNSFVAGYQHGTEQPDNHKIFHLDGGHISWISATNRMNDGSAWIFSGNNTVPDVGVNGDADLVMILPGLPRQICLAVNDLLTIAALPDDANGIETATLFTGTYTNGSGEISEAADVSGVLSACVWETGPNTYFFYHVLISR